MTGATTPQGGGGPQQAATPRFSILAQYVKDLSFENPGGPAALQQARSQPNIQIRVDVRGQKVADNRHEVVLALDIDAKVDDRPLFVLELVYGGLFEILGFPPEALQPLLMVECPRVLFPFARRLVADLTRDGGFPPLMLDLVDFAALYRARLAQQQQRQQERAPGADGGADGAGDGPAG